MRSSLVGVSRGGQTRRKAPIHKWGLSTFGEMYFCVRVRVGWYSACLQLHYPSFRFNALGCWSYLPLFSVMWFALCMHDIPCIPMLHAVPGASLQWTGPRLAYCRG